MWRNQLSINPSDKYVFILSKIPVPADFCLVFGRVSNFHFFTSRSRTAFILTEPPEIHLYPIPYLAQFGHVIGPSFSYLAQLNNHYQTHSFIPWHIGVIYSASSPIKIALTQLETLNLDRSSKLVVINSGKCITPAQKRRIEFIEFLKLRMPQELEVYGRDDRPICDKSTALASSKYHLAIENSQHNGYWTEKLADGLFMRNIVFYCGAPDIKIYFPGSSIFQLNLNNFEESFQTIQMAITQDIYSQLSNEIAENRTRLFDHVSFPNLIENLLKINQLTIQSETSSWDIVYSRNYLYYAWRVLKNFTWKQLRKLLKWAKN